MQSTAGTFAFATGVTTQVISGVGFKAKALVLWTVGTEASNTLSTPLDLGYGLWALGGGLDAMRQRSRWVYRPNGGGVLPTPSWGDDSTKALSTKFWQLAISLPTSTGFTVTWSGTVPNGTQIQYLAIGGDEIQTALAPNPITVVSGPTETIPSELRGINFTPSMAITVGSETTPGNTTPTIGIGVVDGNLNHLSLQGALGTAVFNSLEFRNDRFFGPGILTLATTGFVAGGMNYNVIRGTTASPYELAFDCLLISNILSKAIRVQKPTTAGAQVTSVGFGGKSVLFFGAYNASGLGGPNPHDVNFRAAIGASDGTAHTSSTWIDNHNVATKYAMSRNDLPLIMMDPASPAGFRSWVTAVSFPTSQISVTWAGSGNTADYYGMLILGDNLTRFTGEINETNFFSASEFRYWVALSGDINENAEMFAWGWGNVGNILGVGITTEAGTFVTGGTPDTSTFGFDRTWSALNPAHLSHMNDLADFYSDPGFGFLRYWDGAIPAQRGYSIEEAEFIASKFGRAWDGTGLVTEEMEFRTGYDADTASFGFDRTWDGATRPEHRGYILEDAFFDSYFKIALPTVRMPDADEMAGTINWHINPSVEKGLIGWSGYGSSTLTWADDEAWDRGRSAHISTAGSLAGEGMIIRSVAGLELEGLNERGLPRVSQAQVRLKTAAPSLGLKIKQIVTYLDTTTTVGEELDFTITDDWRYYYAPAVEIDPTKKLRYVEVYVTTPTAMAVGFHADGAQIEEDRGEGPTAWTSGSYGREVGRWSGAPDASMTIREPLQLTIHGVGRGGYAQMSMKLWKTDHMGRYIEDLSYWVESGSVSMSADREITWNFDCIMKTEGWNRIKKNQDWVAPVLRMDYPDGTHSERQLGLYFVVPSSMEHTEWESKVKVTCFDPLWLLKVMAFTGNLRTSEKGVNRMRVVRNVIESTPLMGEPGSGNWNRFDIPGDNRDFKKQREWDKKTNRLTLCNEILEQMGYYPLFTTNLGVITTRRKGEERPPGSGIFTRMADSSPVRAWVAHLPEGASVNAWIPRYADLKSEVVGAITTEPLALDNVDEILIVNDDPDLPRIRVKGKVKRRRRRNGNVRYVVTEPKGKTKKVYANFVEDEATAREVAFALADDLSSRVEHAKIGVLPHPSLDYVHTTGLFAIWNARKEPVIIGQYAFDEVTWNFDLSNCIQTMTLRYIDNGDSEIDGVVF